MRGTAKGADRPAEIELSEVHDHLGYWLRFVTNAVQQGFARRLETTGVGVAEWVILRQLYSTPTYAPGGLADSLGMSRAAMSRLVDRLVEKGMVQRTAERWDRRYQSIALTAKGRALVPQLAAMADENDEEFFGRLSEREQKSFVATLQKLVRRQRLRRRKAAGAGA